MLPADPWRFAWPEPGALIASSTPLLVALSLLVATFASYTSLAVVERMVVAPSVRVRRVWLVLGATAMGSGIWAMHFIAMIAYRLPIQTSYEAGWTVVSLV